MLVGDKFHVTARGERLRAFTYAAAVAQEDADRRQEDGEEHFDERRRRHGSLQKASHQFFSLYLSLSLSEPPGIVPDQVPSLLQR